MRPLPPSRSPWIRWLTISIVFCVPFLPADAQDGTLDERVQVLADAHGTPGGIVLPLRAARHYRYLAAVYVPQLEQHLGYYTQRLRLLTLLSENRRRQLDTSRRLALTQRTALTVCAAEVDLARAELAHTQRLLAVTRQRNALWRRAAYVLGGTAAGLLAVTIVR